MDTTLSGYGPVSQAFLEAGVHTFKEACRFMQGLAYGRINRSEDPMSVLSERKGTCSSKHALLAMLAREYDLPVRLTVGIYLMDEKNTPGIGAVLTKFNLSSLPEAHCYLNCNGTHLDFTGLSDSALKLFLLEKQIEPDRLHLEKVAFHREFLISYYGHDKLDEIWKIREACINALSDASSLKAKNRGGCNGD